MGRKERRRIIRERRRERDDGGEKDEAEGERGETGRIKSVFCVVSETHFLVRGSKERRE